METQTKLLLLSFITSVILVYLILPILRKLKIGQIEREHGPKSHLKKKGIPTMGGIAVLLAIVLVTIFACYHYSKTEQNLVKKIIPLVFIACGYALVGFIDDYKKLKYKNTDGLRPLAKMVGLLVISCIYIYYIVYYLKIGTDIFVPFMNIYITLPLFAYIPLALLVLSGTSNAINLTDGVDGLAASISTLIITWLTSYALIIGGYKEVVIFGSIVIGATLGLLVFNFKPAKLFMGDTGSLLLGGIIAAISLYLKNPLIILLICIIPVIETISVIIQVLVYRKTGKRVFKMAPIHHHFELSGWSENKVVRVFSLITIIACITAFYII